jgi:hypothetical protein
MRGILAQSRANRDWLAATLAVALPCVTMRVPQPGGISAGRDAEYELAKPQTRLVVLIGKSQEIGGQATAVRAGTGGSNPPCSCGESYKLDHSGRQN